MNSFMDDEMFDDEATPAPSQSNFNITNQFDPFAPQSTASSPVATAMDADRSSAAPVLIPMNPNADTDLLGGVLSKQASKTTKDARMTDITYEDGDDDLLSMNPTPDANEQQNNTADNFFDDDGAKEAGGFDLFSRLRNKVGNPGAAAAAVSDSEGESLSFINKPGLDEGGNSLPHPDTLLPGGPRDLLDESERTRDQGNDLLDNGNSLPHPDEVVRKSAVGDKTEEYVNVLDLNGNSLPHPDEVLRKPAMTARTSARTTEDQGSDLLDNGNSLPHPDEVVRKSAVGDKTEEYVNVLDLNGNSLPHPDEVLRKSATGKRNITSVRNITSARKKPTQAQGSELLDNGNSLPHPDEVLRLKATGDTTEEYVDALDLNGNSLPHPDEVVRLKTMSDTTEEYVDALDLNGNSLPHPDEVVRLKAMGDTTEEYVNALDANGNSLPHPDVARLQAALARHSSLESSGSGSSSSDKDNSRLMAALASASESEGLDADFTDRFDDDDDDYQSGEMMVINEDSANMLPVDSGHAPASIRWGSFRMSLRSNFRDARDASHKGSSQDVKFDSRDGAVVGLYVHLANNSHEQKTVKDLAMFYHATWGYPPAKTFCQAIDAGFLDTCPDLSSELILNHLPESMSNSSAPIDDLNSPLPSPRANRGRSHFVGASIVDLVELDELVSTNVSGRFLCTSSRGMNHVFLLYDYDSNAILVAPIESREDVDLLAGYTTCHTRLTAAGITPVLHCLDNEVSKTLRATITENGVKYLLADAYYHDDSPTERASKTFQHHFASILNGCDEQFPAELWCSCLEQTEITLNSLRRSRIHPEVSAYAQIFGQFNYAATPMAPLGSKAAIYEAKSHRPHTYDRHGKQCWYVGPALWHDCHYKVFRALQAPKKPRNKSGLGGLFNSIRPKSSPNRTNTGAATNNRPPDSAFRDADEEISFGDNNNSNNNIRSYNDSGNENNFTIEVMPGDEDIAFTGGDNSRSFNDPDDGNNNYTIEILPDIFGGETSYRGQSPPLSTKERIQKMSSDVWENPRSRKICLAILALLLLLCIVIPLATRGKGQQAQEIGSSDMANVTPAVVTVPPVGVNFECDEDEVVLVDKNGDDLAMNSTVSTEIMAGAEFIACFTTEEVINFRFKRCRPESPLDWIGIFPSRSMFLGRLYKKFYDGVYLCGGQPCEVDSPWVDDPTNQKSSPPRESSMKVPPIVDPGEYRMFMVKDSAWPYEYLKYTPAFRVVEDKASCFPSPKGEGMLDPSTLAPTSSGTSSGTFSGTSSGTFSGTVYGTSAGTIRGRASSSESETNPENIFDNGTDATTSSTDIFDRGTISNNTEASDSDSTIIT